MNWTQIEGQWHQFTGHVKSTWAKLTDDDLKNVAGKKDQLVGKVQERYGVLKEDAEKQVDEWMAKVTPLLDKADKSKANKAPPTNGTKASSKHT
jgi:uncharacterized protein YjbJ (UPF0337 family)